MIKLAPARSCRIFLSLAAMGVVGVICFRAFQSDPKGQPLAPTTRPVAVADTPSAIPPPPKPPADPAVFAKRSKTFDWFRAKPFAVVKSSGAHEWTAEDGRTPDAILDLAHNDLEAQRLMEENDRIKRRQLVYRKDTMPALLDRARAAGEPLKSFTLPGFDGQEYEVEVTAINAEPSLRKGAVIGRLKGHFNSLATIGFANGYESYNIVAPDDHLYLVADAREPGEMMVKEIDPDKYAPADGDEPDFIVANKTSSLR